MQSLCKGILKGNPIGESLGIRLRDRTEWLISSHSFYIILDSLTQALVERGFSFCVDWQYCTHCFIGPVVLLEDLLSSILSSICEHHYHLIAVCPWSTGLLREKGWSEKINKLETN